MSAEQSQVDPLANRLLESAVGMSLAEAGVVKEGFRFVYENATQVLVLLLAPKVYTDGTVIVDAINDLVIIASATRYDPAAYRQDGANATPVSEEKIELPYSTWFFPGNYR